MPHPHKLEYDRPNRTAILTVECLCGVAKTFRVPSDKYLDWTSDRPGNNIQNCFPEIPAADREMLISGTCPKCWAGMFPTEEEEESSDHK